MRKINKDFIVFNTWTARHTYSTWLFVCIRTLAGQTDVFCINKGLVVPSKQTIFGGVREEARVFRMRWPVLPDLTHQEHGKTPVRIVFGWVSSNKIYRRKRPPSKGDHQYAYQQKKLLTDVGTDRRHHTPLVTLSYKSLINDSMYYTVSTLYQKSEKWNCVTSFPIPTFMYLWAIYIFPILVCLFGCSKIGRPIFGIYKVLAVHECGNWETEH